MPNLNKQYRIVSVKANKGAFFVLIFNRENQGYHELFGVYDVGSYPSEEQVEKQVVSDLIEANGNNMEFPEYPNKPDCFNCKWNVFQKTSKCTHPVNKILLKDPTKCNVDIYAEIGENGIGAPLFAKSKLLVSTDSSNAHHKIFNWPFKFNPFLVNNCDGFEERS